MYTSKSHFVILNLLIKGVNKMSRRKHRHFTAEFKAEAVKLVIEQGYKQIEAARNLDIDPSILGKWVRAAKAVNNIVAAFPGKGNMHASEAEIINLKKQLTKTTRERDILKKALGYFASHPE